MCNGNASVCNLICISITDNHLPTINQNETLFVD